MGCNPSAEQIEHPVQLPPPPQAPQTDRPNNPEAAISKEKSHNNEPDEAIEEQPPPISEEKKKDQAIEKALEHFVDQIFDNYDVNKRGQINIVEFGKLLKDYVDPNITQAEIKEFFGIADLSGDKKLDKKELLTLYRTLIKY